MKHPVLSSDQTRKPFGKSNSTGNAELKYNEKNFVPAVDEVSRRAYFAYVSQGCLPGHDVQHWLEAEAQLIEERNHTRMHGFHNRT